MVWQLENSGSYGHQSYFGIHYSHAIGGVIAEEAHVGFGRGLSDTVTVCREIYTEDGYWGFRLAAGNL